MNELQFASRIRHLLEQGKLDTAITEKLHRARELALSRQRPEPAPVLVWAATAPAVSKVRRTRLRTPTITLRWMRVASRDQPGPLLAVTSALMLRSSDSHSPRSADPSASCPPYGEPDPSPLLRPAAVRRGRNGPG